jgi:hypothetical protein
MVRGTIIRTGRTALVSESVSQGCIFIAVTLAAPNARSLGATNGLSQTTVSIARTCGPAISASMFAFSVEHNLLGGYAVFVVFAVLSTISLLVAVQLPERDGGSEVE